MRTRIWVLFLLIVCLSTLSQSFTCQAQSLPSLADYMNKLVFQNIEFTQPILFCLPSQDSREDLTEIRTTRFGMEKIFYPAGYRKIDKHVLSYLLEKGFAQVESAKVSAQYGLGTTYQFLFYTNKFNALPLTSDKDKVCVTTAKRRLKSIDYQNKYKGSPQGVPLQFHAITFSYLIEGNLPEIAELGKIYSGKAKAFQDPDDGKWKLMNFELEDRGEKEILSQIKSQYEPYDPIAKEAPAVALSVFFDNLLNNKTDEAILSFSEENRIKLKEDNNFNVFLHEQKEMIEKALFEGVKIVSVTYNDNNTSIVTYKFKFKNGDMTSGINYPLIKEDGKWFLNQLLK